MDIQEPNLRRSDFEAMHPTAKLFNFYAEKMVYFGDGSESINSQWTTWCACIGMFHLEIKEAKAQAVLEGFVLVPKEPTPKMIDATWNFDEEIQDMSHNSRNEFIYNAMIAAAQEKNQ